VKVDKAVVETLAVELLVGLKLKDAAQQTNKKKAGSKRKQRNKPTLEEKIFDKKKPASNKTKQSKLPLQPPQTPEKPRIRNNQEGFLLEEQRHWQSLSCH
jgi:hypothetical protein